jgi:non-ribosomal peptide synthetase component F
LQKGDVTAIYAHRSADLVVALLGIHKAGGAFVILDPAYPPQRLVSYLEICQPKGFIHLASAGPLPREIERP